MKYTGIILYSILFRILIFFHLTSSEHFLHRKHNFYYESNKVKQQKTIQNKTEC